MKAFITGCTSKLGAHIVEAFEARGIEVIGHYNNNKPSVLKDAFCADFTSQQSFEELLHKIERYLPIDILINNAAIFKADAIGDFSDENFFEHVKINALAPIKLTRFIASNQKENLRVVNILDAMLLRGTTAHFTYYLSKKTLEAASILIKRSFKNVKIKNLYLPKMTTKMKIDRLNQILCHLVKL
ncbi:SDR family NAD(P)-dependent oxidoreductase [Candidatus Phycorickettsia trachydisci]|nr:SDR family NAD(P)-dependent oxidoreductase [Candidatus Phycorickettsia trachydisci]